MKRFVLTTATLFVTSIFLLVGCGTPDYPKQATRSATESYVEVDKTEPPLPLVMLPHIIVTDYMVGNGLDELSTDSLPTSRTVLIIDPGLSPFENAKSIGEHVMLSCQEKGWPVAACYWVDVTGKVLLRDFEGSILWKPGKIDYRSGTGYFMEAFSRLSEAMWQTHDLFEKDLSFKLPPTKRVIVVSNGDIEQQRGEEIFSRKRAERVLKQSGVEVINITSPEMKERPSRTIQQRKEGLAYT